MIPTHYRLCLLLGALLFSGCALLPDRLPPPVPEAERISRPARQILDEISRRNAGLNTYKGIGTLALRHQGQSQQARLAWLAAVPEKVRLEVLMPSGQPFLSLSTDGRHVYLLKHSGKKRFLKRSAEQITLEAFIHVPITPETIITILAGQIPLIDYYTASLASADGQPDRLVLTDRKKERTEIIHLDPDTGAPFRLEFLEKNARPLFIIERRGSRRVDRYEIPETITLTAAGGTSAVITVDRYWANTEISPEKFILNDPRG
ncbi:MAG: hypothetical protein ACLFPD_11530 [Desulfosudaceae bacterium]